MKCPHCGKEIVTPVYAEPVNTAGAPAPSSLFVAIVTNGNSQIPLINTVCAAGAAQQLLTHYITFGADDKR